MVKIVESFQTQQVNLQQQNDENDDAAPACISIMTGDDWDQDIDGHMPMLCPWLLWLHNTASVAG